MARQRAVGGGTASAPRDVLDAYARRGRECAYANVRMLGRIIGAYYDEALRPADVRAAQLALLWAVLASEPVDHKTLGRITRTDQTTLSRTVEHLHAAGLVLIEPGEDRRSRQLRLSQRGRRVFLRAMPYWEEAQRAVAEALSLGELAAMSKAARGLRQRGGPPAQGRAAGRRARRDPA
jgi:DNA-binding MarR family transcriptional regulator